jgi:hypothetical protein
MNGLFLSFRKPTKVAHHGSIPSSLTPLVTCNRIPEESFTLLVTTDTQVSSKMKFTYERYE